MRLGEDIINNFTAYQFLLCVQLNSILSGTRIVQIRLNINKQNLLFNFFCYCFIFLLQFFFICVWYGFSLQVFPFCHFQR